MLALVDGGFTVKRYRQRGDVVVLQAENPAFPDIIVTEERGFDVWGIITHCIRML